MPRVRVLMRVMRRILSDANSRRLDPARRSAGVTALMLLALCAILVRGLVPAGYMLAAGGGAEGRLIRMTVCEGHASRVRFVDLETGHAVDSPQDNEEPAGSSESCVFAGLPGLAVPPDGDRHEPPFAAPRFAPAPRPDILPGRGLAAPPPPATGPPQAA